MLLDLGLPQHQYSYHLNLNDNSYSNNISSLAMMHNHNSKSTSNLLPQLHYPQSAHSLSHQSEIVHNNSIATYNKNSYYQRFMINN